MRHAFEIRHDSFRTPQFVDLLRQYNVALVCADTVEWPDGYSGNGGVGISSYGSPAPVAVTASGNRPDLTPIIGSANE